MVTVLPFDDEADAIALANDTALRAVRIDLDRQPVAGAAGVARRGIGQPVGQFALVGALQHAVRRVQAVRTGPRARPRRAAALHRNQERLLSRSEKPDGFDPTTGRARSPSSPAAPAASVWPPAKRMHAEGATIVIGDIDPTTGKAAADELDGLFVPVDVSDQAAVDDAVRHRRRDLRIGRHRVQQRRHLTARRRPDREHRAAAHGRGCRTSTSSRCTCAAGPRCGTWCRARRARSSTPRRSSR